MKKGEASVGVQRQYCGRLAKVENCQVGVFLSLGREVRAALEDFRLFLPAAWAKDEKRCDMAKAPEAHRVHRTKPELALEMVAAARARGSTHRWVGGDAACGSNHAFTTALEDMGETFVMDVACTLRVWENDPGPQLPPSKPGRKGRPRQRAQAVPSTVKAVRVDVLTARNFANAAREVTIRDATNWPLPAKLWVRPVWVWEGKAPAARPRLSIVRPEADGTFKYALSNAAADTPWARLALMPAQRFWIERCFQDAKVGSRKPNKVELNGLAGAAVSQPPALSQKHGVRKMSKPTHPRFFLTQSFCPCLGLRLPSASQARAATLGHAITNATAGTPDLAINGLTPSGCPPPLQFRPR
ncbi:MAG: transposase [Opitutus sp.]|nr:transposase [Opitutus sp.]